MTWNLKADVRLDELVRDWIDDIQLDPETADLYRLHWATHLIPFFGQAQAITPLTISAYCRARLKRVKRVTLQKERSTLRGFLAWCQELGHLSVAIDLPPLPKRATGTAWHQPRRGAATELSQEEVAMLLAALPAWSTPRGGRNAFPVRARFVVAYETALRPATLDALSCPEHWTRGAKSLRIPDEIDKARFGRELPLTDTAQAALESVGRRGLIFGAHDYRHQLGKAALQVLGAARGAKFTAYDLRHARLTHLAEGGNLPGVAYIAGHKRVTTTALYVRPGLRAAKRTLALAEPPSIEVLAPERVWGFESPSSHEQQSSPIPSPAGRGEVLSAESLADGALALLGSAAEGVAVSEDDIRDFALAALLSPDAGPELCRLVHGVLSSGEHAPRRAIELCRLILAQARTDRALLTEGRL
jgi:integrase